MAPDADLYRPRDDEPGPLAGTRVLDLTRARAGPTCVRQLADLGADVVQIGHPRKGDLRGSDYHNLHRNKRSILVDLAHDGGRAAFLRMVEAADVVVENFRAPVKHRLGIDYETLARVNPRLVYASLSGFGQEGPYAARPGLDPVAQGMGGLMSVTGEPGSGPWRAGIAVSDTAAGTFLTQGVLAALLVRERTGRGQWVHTSLLEAMVNFMDFQAERWLIDGEVPEQAGNDHPTLFPMGTYATRDGHLTVAAVMGWDRFLDAIDGRDIEADPRFADAASRARHRAALARAIEAKLRARDTAEWVEILNAAGLPSGPVYRMDEVFADPQVRHLAMTRTVRHATDGDVELLRWPVTLSETPAGVRCAAPVPGADAEALLRELGFGDAEVRALFESGAVVRERTGGGWG